jgi:hypothetical protein
MPGQIFVPLGKRDRIEEIIPYLDVLARPSMQVVVLTPYREKVSWMKVQLTAMQTGTKAITTITALTANASRQAHLRSVEERIHRGRQELQKKGMTVVIHCYSGPLRNAIANLRDADNKMIVLLSEHTIIDKFVARARNFFGQFGTDDAAPILFFRPRRQH